MARSRNIKPGFFTNDELAEVEPLGRLLFAGLWTLADRAGRLEDRPKKIKVEVLPYDDCDVDLYLQQLHDRGFIIRYEVNEERYIQITNFKIHQNPHKNEKPSDIPEPCLHAITPIQVQYKYGATPVQKQDKHSTTLGLEQIDNEQGESGHSEKPSNINGSKDSGTSTVQAPCKHSTTPVIDGTTRADSFNLIPDSLNSDSLNLIPDSNTRTGATDGLTVDNSIDNLSPKKGNLRLEDGGLDGSDSGPHGELSTDGNPDFMDFWNEYPKKIDIGSALKEWTTLIKQGVRPVDLVLAAKKYATYLKTHGKEQFTKKPHNFLLEGTYLEYLPKHLPDCPYCRGSGWREVEDSVGYRGVNTKVVPCDCGRGGAVSA